MVSFTDLEDTFKSSSFSSFSEILSASSKATLALITPHTALNKNKATRNLCALNKKIRLVESQRFSYDCSFLPGKHCQRELVELKKKANSKNKVKSVD